MEEKKQKVKAQFISSFLFGWLIQIIIGAMIQATVVFFTSLGLKKWWEKKTNNPS
jgi:hypothetical protein